LIDERKDEVKEDELVAFVVEFDTVKNSAYKSMERADSS
jgi:hypothetical protein